MKLRPAKANKGKRDKDPKKEELFEQLVSVLESLGISVRRAELKSGAGWKVLSGSCRVHEQAIIFIDRRMPQDEQISLLVERLVILKSQIPKELLEQLPAKIVEALYPELRAA